MLEDLGRGVNVASTIAVSVSHIARVTNASVRVKGLTVAVWGHQTRLVHNRVTKETLCTFFSWKRDVAVGRGDERPRGLHVVTDRNQAGQEQKYAFHQIIMSYHHLFCPFPSQ